MIVKEGLRSSEIDSQPGGPVRQPYMLYRLARQHRLAASIPRNRCLGSINVYKYGLRCLFISFSHSFSVSLSAIFFYLFLFPAQSLFIYSHSSIPFSVLPSPFLFYPILPFSYSNLFSPFRFSSFIFSFSFYPFLFSPFLFLPFFFLPFYFLRLFLLAYFFCLYFFCLSFLPFFFLPFFFLHFSRSVFYLFFYPII